MLGDSAHIRRQRAGEAAERAAAGERARIARELHDIVSHHVSVIALQAETAQALADTSPDEATDAMARVSTSGGQALDDLRRLLDVLRGDDDGDRSRGPQPDLASVGDLLAPVRDAGVAVDLTVDGAFRPLPAGVETSAYRIIQESLTNVLRHAPGARNVNVAVRYGESDLVVRVTDDGPGGNGPREDTPGARSGGAGPGQRGGHPLGHGDRIGGGRAPQRLLSAAGPDRRGAVPRRPGPCSGGPGSAGPRGRAAPPVVLAVDDAHLLDETSAALVHHVALAGVASIVLTVRSGAPAPDAIVALWKDEFLERVAIAPLPQVAAANLVNHMVGGPVDEADVLTRGAPEANLSDPTSGEKLAGAAPMAGEGRREVPARAVEPGGNGHGRQPGPGHHLGQRLRADRAPSTPRM